MIVLGLLAAGLVGLLLVSDRASLKNHDTVGAESSGVIPYYINKASSNTLRCLDLNG